MEALPLVMLATNLSYDLQGNLTSDGAQKYVWDVAGRLKQVWTSDGETLKEESQYDAYGRRVKHWVYTTSDTAYYYYDGWRVVEEWVDPDEDAPFLQARNVWGTLPR